MTGDELVVSACATPSDTTARLVLADWLAENGEEELETALRSELGEALIRRTWQQADHLKRRPCLRLLWACAIAYPQRGFSLPMGTIPCSGVVPNLQDYLRINPGGVFTANEHWDTIPNNEIKLDQITAAEWALGGNLKSKM